jgi:hypothetical protein
MFKRALQAHHWMAIGLEKWNELENMEITETHIKRMRKIKGGSEDSDDDQEFTSDAEGSQSAQSSSNKADPEVCTTDDSEFEEGPIEEVGDEQLEKELVSGSFVLCPICPNRKFLTENEMNDHLKSKGHLKKERALSEPCEVRVVVPQRPKKDKGTKPVKDQKPQSKNNRKARRANLARTDISS